MSSQRFAKIATSVFQLIGGSLADPAEPLGPPCPCDGCRRAWWRNQGADHASPRKRAIAGLGRVSAG